MRWPQFTVPIGDVDLHFIHAEGAGPRPMPLLLSHGWPGSVWEFHKILPLLTDPGGTAAIRRTRSPSSRRRCPVTASRSRRISRASTSRASPTSSPG